MKNYYVDYFRFASKHVHFIHFKARSRLPNDVVAKVEGDLREQVLKANDEIDEAIVQAEALMRANGIMLSITDTPNCSPPLCHTAEIISPLANRYIQLIEKTDYLLRALDPLFQKEVITMEEYNLRRGLFKRHVKRFYYACRRFDEGLRGRMDAREAAGDKADARNKGHSTAEVKSNGAASTAVTDGTALQPVGRKKRQRPQLEVGSPEQTGRAAWAARDHAEDLGSDCAHGPGQSGLGIHPRRSKSQAPLDAM